MQTWFTPTPFVIKRIKTNQVKIGSLIIGSEHPVKVQSMANTSTSNVIASVKQAIEIIEAGGQLVRFTVINLKDAEALKQIKEQLVKQGYNTPIIADIHFNPDLANVAASYVDKVRINPGNYIDKRATFIQVDYTQNEYKQELNKLKEQFVAFLNVCNKHHTAIRIGTNHGSLSDRIMSKYGDTPAGMVEATMEFLRICKDKNFSNVLVSLKSSNTRVMVQAYRLLALQMQKEQMQFALHLGVTEAGSDEDGRIKSAVGIGALMNDGLGDTIRVSLTEHPAKEIPVSNALVKHFESMAQSSIESIKPNYNPYVFKASEKINALNKNEPIVVGDISNELEISKEVLEGLGFVFNHETKHIERSDTSPDVIYTGEQIFPFNTPENTVILSDCNHWDKNLNAYPLFSFHDYLTIEKKSDKQNWVQIELKQLNTRSIELIKNDKTIVLVAYSYHKNSTSEIRQIINLLSENNCQTPIVIQQSYNELSHSNFQLKSAADNGLFFIDGLAQGLWLKNTFKNKNCELSETAFSILQAARSRTTKTEYISCPGCGRTLFELEKTLKEVKEATAHLKGLKIAVMGCIVNGPGEMADADYGYVGAGLGKVSLYKGKKLIKRDINTENAVEELLQLIEEKN